MVNFHFTNLKVTDKHFFSKTLMGKYQLSKSRGACHALSFVDVLQLSCDILSLLADHIKHMVNFA